MERRDGNLLEYFDRGFHQLIIYVNVSLRSSETAMASQCHDYFRRDAAVGKSCNEPASPAVRGRADNTGIRVDAADQLAQTVGGERPTLL